VSQDRPIKLQREEDEKDEEEEEAILWQT